MDHLQQVTKIFFAMIFSSLGFKLFSVYEFPEATAYGCVLYCSQLTGNCVNNSNKVGMEANQ